MISWLAANAPSGGQTPTWVASIIVGTFTLAAAVLTQLNGNRSEQRKLRQEDRRRWYAEQRRIAAEFAQHIDALHALMHRNWTGSPPWVEILEAAQRARTNKFELEMVAPKTVSNAATGLWMCIAGGIDALRKSDRTVQQRDEQLARYNKKVKEFIDAVRSALGASDDWLS